MTVRTNELRQRRAALVHEAQALLDNPNREHRTAIHNRFDTIMADVDKLGDEIQRLERSAVETRSLDFSRRADLVSNRGYVETKDETGELRRWDGYLRGQIEARALAGDTDTSGGYLVAPQQMAAEIVKAIDNANPVRQLATKFPVTGSQSLGVVSLDADPADADWTSELATGSEDSTMAFGRRELHPRPIAKRLKVSATLLQQVPSAASLVSQRLAYKFGATCEKAYMTGDGAKQPLGIFTASSDGISTARDVTTGSTTLLTADSLIDCLYTLKPQYLNSPNLRWLFHRDAVKQIRKFKDGDGRYIWQPGIAEGQPDTLLGVGCVMSEYAPNTFTTGLYVGALADFSYYWIADSLQFTAQRLEELYAETNQIGFIGRLQTDGMPVLEEAFVRLKLS